eukprot:15433586-Alexandrium_andersonii.AAC.1
MDVYAYGVHVGRPAVYHVAQNGVLRDPLVVDFVSPVIQQLSGVAWEVRIEQPFFAHEGAPDPLVSEQPAH